SPVEREPAGELARLLVLHALLAPLQEVVAPAPARARRRVEVEPALPVQVVEADLAPQPPRALEDVEVGVAPLDARADVGVEAEPGLDLLRASLDHRDAHRRRLGAVAVGDEVRLRADEVAGGEEPPLVEAQRLPPVGRAALDGAQLRDHGRRIALGAAHLDIAVAEEGAAVD